MKHYFLLCYLGVWSIKNINADEFKVILEKPTFVDKTIFIKDLLEGDNFTLITAPPKFGKSTVVKMVKRFLELEVNKDGNPTTNANYNEEKVTDTSNYDLFKKNDLAINRFPDCFREHFGRTPVIEVNLELDSPDVVIESLQDAARVFKEAIHRSFVQHNYLIHSDRLTTEHRHYVQMWCDDHSYKTMVDTLYVSHALQSLSQYLRTHFNGRKVFVLVDNYDYVIRNALCRVTSVDQVTRIVNYATGIIRDVLKGNEENVMGALITGISDFPFLNKTDFGDCYTHRFLGDHRYFNTFGFTREEIVRLFARSKRYINSKEFDLHYNGYQTIKGHSVYNMFSTLRFLQTGLYESYFATTAFPNHLKVLLSLPSIESAVEALTENKTLAMEVCTNTLIEDYMNLYGSNLGAYTDSEVPSIFLNSLFDWGFLTYDPQQESFLNDVVVIRNFVGVKLPNNEVKDFLGKQLNLLNS